jgi:chromosome segregation protein
MRLKSIKLAGFKSFVDPTTVQLPSNMCAVVGPNGCGKSNIIDAVRWVMGESSAKNLRGESMADVIFNGSGNRQPVGQASIELVFDNHDGGIGGEYASYGEISIRRQVTRDGQSEYFLNGTRCRRRDITDIFLGTGLGPRSYAIIEQGMISRLIESKPEDLRVFIEEAAGISKYKERRRETESRMRRTLENLERLTDLRDELERQLQHLKRQSQAAERYKALKEEERTLKQRLTAAHWRALDSEGAAAAHEVGELEVRFESVLAEQQSVDTRLEQLRVAQGERNDSLAEVQGRYYAVGAEVSRIEQELRHQGERAQQIAADLLATTTGLEQARRHLEEDGERLASWEAELAGLEPQLLQLRESSELAAAELADAESQMQSWQASWDEFNQRAAGPRQQAEVQQSRIQHLEHSLARLQKRLEQLQQERQAQGDVGGEGGIEQLAREQGAAAAALQTAREALEATESALAGLRQERDDCQGRLNEVRSQLQVGRGRLSSLEALQQAARQRADGGGVERWLQAQGLEGQPRLLESLQVEPRWQRAVETVLGGLLQAVCLERSDELQHKEAALAALEGGELALISPQSDAPAPAGTLAAQVRGDTRACSLLRAVYCADSADAARSRLVTLAPGESVITPEGLWLGGNWARRIDGGDAEHGAIERQQELETLQQRCAQLEEDARSAERALADCEERLAAAESRRRNERQAAEEQGRRQSDALAQLRAEEARQEQRQTRRQRIEQERAELQSQYAQEQQAMADARGSLAAAIETMESDSAERETQLSGREALRAALDAARAKAHRERDTSHQSALKHQSLLTQRETIRGAIERAREQLTTLTERRGRLEQAQGDNDAPVENLRGELEQRLAERVTSEEALAEARQALAQVEHALREAERERLGIEQRGTAIREDLEKRRLARQSLQLRQDALVGQLHDLGADLAPLLEALPEAVDTAAWERELERIGASINRLGPINLAAVEEYQQQSERKQYLDAQNEDLESALETLESAIRKIDRETRSRFRETFDQVNSGLQELFPRVFGGGSANLEMTGDDLLDTGISILARPPGKKNSTIHLLSGGEKALTAIALVFAIFQLNPAPFCMLDEVDAPLDDANVGRYARMVKEMSDKVQFVFITHNKITMEMADHLMGVTMHEPGVSRLVSVDVEEAAELAAS